MKQLNFTFLTIALLTASLVKITASEFGHQKINDAGIKKIAASWNACRAQSLPPAKQLQSIGKPYSLEKKQPEQVIIVVINSNRKDSAHLAGTRIIQA